MARGDTTSRRPSWGCWLSPLLFFFVGWVSAEEDCDPLSDGSCLEQPAGGDEAKSDAQLAYPPPRGLKEMPAAPGPEVQAGEASVYPPFHGAKHVITIPPFASRVENVDENVGKRLSEILAAELIKSNRFVVPEQETMEDSGKEQELEMPGGLPEGAAPRVTSLPSAQYTIEGAITEYHVLAGRGVTVGYGKGAVGTKARTAYVGVDVLIVDKTTGEVHGSYNTTTKARSSGVKLKIGKKGVDLSHEFGDYKEGIKIEGSDVYRKSLRQATEDAVQQLIEFIITQSQQIPWRGSVIGADTGNIYIDRGADTNIQVGDRLVVYSEGEPLIDKETGISLGSEEERLCNATVEAVQRTFSIARPESDCRERAVERGSIVRLH